MFNWFDNFLEQEKMFADEMYFLIPCKEWSMFLKDFGIKKLSRKFIRKGN